MKVLLFILALNFVMLGYARAQSEANSTPQIDVRTKEVAETLRCVVCKNQSIASSDAALAKDLRALVRERIVNGDTNEEARDYVVARYGEFVLLKPTFTARNFGLWFGPFLVLALAFAGAMAFISTRKRGESQISGLTAEEQTEIDDYLDRNH